MGILINIFTFPTQIEAIQALQKLEQLEDEKLLSKFVMIKDPTNKPYLIEKSKDGFRNRQYLDWKNEGGPFGLELTPWEDLKTYGLGFHDRYFAAIEKGVPAGKAVLVVFAYEGWNSDSIEQLSSPPTEPIRATANPDIFSPEMIASIIAARYQG